MGVTAASYGDAAIRCEVDSLGEAHALFAQLQDEAGPEVRNVVPGWRTVVVSFSEPGRHVTSMLDRLREVVLEEIEVPLGRRHELTITYDGPDLDAIAVATGFDEAEVIRRHLDGEYVVAFLGFSPGFPYLAGLDPELAVPRHETPRARVDAGSVGIAGDVTGIYPSASPGGWQILGHVAEQLFDVTATPPAMLAPGDRVTFVRA